VRRPDLAALAAAMDGCRGCPLWEPATQAVPGAGPADARVVLVGEQPGDQEDRAGRPFVGPAGRPARRGARGGRHRPVDGVRHERRQALQVPRAGQAAHPRLARHLGGAACTPWLQAEMAALRPEVVVLLGATAGKAVFGPSFRVTQSRGVLCRGRRRATREVRLGQALATLHPSAGAAGRRPRRRPRRARRDLRVVAAVL
jgi:DNA polymerase